jgi:hypothetical protein
MRYFISPLGGENQYKDEIIINATTEAQRHGGRESVDDIIVSTINDKNWIMNTKKPS